MDKKKVRILCLIILLAGGAITALIYLTEPEAKREGASVQTAILVDVLPVERGKFEPVITATGTVQPVEDVTISPMVSGQVIRRDAGFTPGGFVKKNEILLQIDPSDYRNTLELRTSELLQSETNMAMEMGRQQVAEQDLQLIGGDSLSGNERELVLRKPQLNAVKATIRASQAVVEQAKVNLGRTTIRAPFDAHILSQNVTLGSQVAPGDDLGRLVGTDFYWVNANVQVSQLQWLSFPKISGEKGSPVEIKNSTAWLQGASREGYLDRQVGALDEQTRLARVLVKVEDPLGYYENAKEQPKLMIGAFVELGIRAKPLENVIRLEKGYVRNNDTVWVMKDGKLEIREVEVILTDDTYAYIRQGLENGEMIVTTNLSAITEGIELRTEDRSDKQASKEKGSDEG